MKSFGFSSILSSGNHLAMMWVTWNSEYWFTLTPMLRVIWHWFWKRYLYCFLQVDLLPMVDNLLQVLLALENIHYSGFIEINEQNSERNIIIQQKNSSKGNSLESLSTLLNTDTLIMVMSITRISLTRAFFRNSLLPKHVYGTLHIYVLWVAIKTRNMRCSWMSNWPESRLALSLSPRYVKVLAHDGDVSPPGLVQGEHPQPGLSLQSDWHSQTQTDRYRISTTKKSL